MTQFCFEVLEHVSDTNKALQNIKCLAHSNTLFFFSIPFCFHIHGDPFDFCRYTEDGFKEILKRNQYKLITSSSFGGYYSCIADLILLAPFIRVILFPLRFITKFIHVFFPNSKLCPSGYIFVASLEIDNEGNAQ